MLAVLFSCPIFVIAFVTKKLKVKYKFIIYLPIAIVTTAILTLALGWWFDTSNQILLSYYGYDYSSMNSTERFRNISAENMERVKDLEISHMGIGWLLKALMILMIYSIILPYIVIAYFICFLIARKSKMEDDTPYKIRDT